jgi:hypothetical protein
MTHGPRKAIRGVAERPALYFTVSVIIKYVGMIENTDWGFFQLLTAFEVSSCDSS